jgi:hypothetical protein
VSERGTKKSRQGERKQEKEKKEQSASASAKKRAWLSDSV